MTTYSVMDMRIVRPSAKAATRNPNLAFIVKGKFFSENGEELSFTSKAITVQDVRSDEFQIDISSGTLVTPGSRGRKAAPTLSESDLDSLLNSLRS